MGRPKAFDEDKVIDSAVDCFWSRGYETTSVRDLAERMGIGGASLYNTYGDKRTLFTKALERYANRSMRERIARLEAAHRPKQAIRAFPTEIVERSRATSTRFAPSSDAMSRPPVPPARRRERSIPRAWRIICWASCWAFACSRARAPGVACSRVLHARPSNCSICPSGRAGRGGLRD